MDNSKTYAGRPAYQDMLTVQLEGKPTFYEYAKTMLYGPKDWIEIRKTLKSEFDAKYKEGKAIQGSTLQKHMTELGWVSKWDPGFKSQTAMDYIGKINNLSKSLGYGEFNYETFMDNLSYDRQQEKQNNSGGSAWIPKK